MTCTAAMEPDAPARFSTTTGCLSRSASFWPTMRAAVSVGPPGGNGTTSLMGLVGQACAMAAVPVRAAKAPTTAAMQVRRPMCVMGEKTGGLFMV